MINPYFNDIVLSLNLLVDCHMQRRQERGTLPALIPGLFGINKTIFPLRHNPTGQMCNVFIHFITKTWSFWMSHFLPQLSHNVMKLSSILAHPTQHIEWMVTHNFLVTPSKTVFLMRVTIRIIAKTGQQKTFTKEFIGFWFLCRIIWEMSRPTVLGGGGGITEAVGQWQLPWSVCSFIASFS